MLVEADADVHANIEGDTALIIEAQNGGDEPAAEWDGKTRDVIRVLLGAGGDPAATNVHGGHALAYATHEELPLTVALLEQALAAKARPLHAA